MGTRVRRPFSFRDGGGGGGGNSDDDSDEPALDEQEQEDLIASLKAQNNRRNAQFRLLLLALPAVSALPYALAVLSPSSSPASSSSSTSARDLLTCLLALSSLACTAWTLWALEPGVTGLLALDRWIAGGGGGGANASSTTSFPERGRGAGGDSLLQVPATMAAGRSRGSRRGSSASSQFSAWFPQPRTPLEVYLPYLNLGLCGFLGLLALLASTSTTANSSGRLAIQHWGHVSLGYLPGLVHLVVLAAKVMMGSVDPERELGGLRYEYKGA